MNSVYRASSKGSAIILALLTLWVLTVIGLSLLNMDINHIDINNNDKVFEAAYYYAEAGLQQQIEILYNHMEDIYYDSQIKDRDSFFGRLMRVPIIPPTFDKLHGERVIINISVKKSKSPEYGDEIIIISKCRIGDIKRSILGKIQIDWVKPIEGEHISYDRIFSVVEWYEVR